MSASQPPNDGPALHPNFSSYDSDLTLVTKDGIAFRTYSVLLRETSGFFRDILSLPQPQAQSPIANITIHLDEDASAIEPVLVCIAGKALPALDSLEALESLAHVAEKYDMPGPLSIIQRLLNISSLVEKNPLSAYKLASRYRWSKEASFASSKAISVDLSDPANAASLKGIDSDDLLSLFHLRRAREQSLSSSLHGAGLEEPQRCTACGGSEDMDHWESFRRGVIVEFATKDPTGSFITNSTYLQWPSCSKLLGQRCRCGDPYVSAIWVVRLLQDATKKLPTGVDQVILCPKSLVSRG